MAGQPVRKTTGFFLSSHVSLKWIVLIFLFRLANALLIQTFFQPDEYYQALEPAHRFVFGYGYETWEWKQGLRSSIHVWLYIVAYKLGLFLGFSDDSVVWYAPRVTGAVLATLAEVYLYKFALRFSALLELNSTKLPIAAVLLSLSNPFNWFFLTRSFSNGFEMLLTVAALAHWPWHRRGFSSTSFYISCALAFTSCLVRPTNGLTWLYLGTRFLWERPWSAQLVKLVFFVAIELLVIVGASALLDFQFYGHWTFPTYNFVEFNVVRNLSIFYGLAPWHFHLGQSVPVLLTTQLPLVLFSLAGNIFPTLSRLMAVNVVAFSLIKHKEFRFLYPLQPVFMVAAAPVAVKLWRLKKRTAIVASYLVGLVAIALFFTLRHESGVLKVVEFLGSDPLVSRFAILAPCHSTPWQSHLHQQRLDDSWFVTCEPPLGVKGLAGDIVRWYKDESDVFYDDPAAYVAKLPRDISHYVVFSPLESTMVLLGFQETKRFFNSDFHWDPRRWGDIIVYTAP